MNKEKLLEKSRANQIDEGREYYDMQGIKNGFYYMSIIYGVIAVFNLITGYAKGATFIPFYVASSLYFCFCASLGYQRYKFDSNKKHKIEWISASIASSIFLLNYIVRVLWP